MKQALVLRKRTSVNAAFKKAQKDAKHLGYLCEKNWSQDLTKIAQAGHTVIGIVTQV